MEDKILSIVRKIKLLSEKKDFKISTAESCTGGMLSAYLTAISGSSKYFESGIVSYSNEVKKKILLVKKETIEKYGAVSIETASEMALSVRSLTNSDFSISITGVAGPTGGSINKPVGTVCIAIVNKDGKVIVDKHIFQGDRGSIRLASCLQALEILLPHLNYVH